MNTLVRFIQAGEQPTVRQGARTTSAVRMPAPHGDLTASPLNPPR
jgi:hypothetical protein